MSATTGTAGTTAPAAPPIRRRRSGRRRSAVVGYLFVAPVALGLLALYLYPAISTFLLSFTHWGPFGGNTFSGLTNYAAVFSSDLFWRALLNTIAYMAIGLLVIPVAIVIAALLNKPGLRGVAVYRALYFIPFITLPVASGMVWKWLYNGEYGLINSFLEMVGIPGTYWVANPATALVAIGIVQVWSQVGYYLVIFIAGIKAIPTEYSEAAEIDGAGPFRRFFHITLPLLSPSIFFCTVINVIATLQIFDLIYVMTQSSGANPAHNATQSIVTLFYETAFVNNDKGTATALAFLLMLLIAALTAVQFRLQRRWVQYA
ncbi:carbohydrate ABC transporter permease [Georgenia alba]|uniref:Carbohydrate ABC transporter permease n=1 Tax=Georgenia alba TaxID=2233858 RepID=A0ABW2Q380_9MICO